jgi:hypothetical protein
VSKKKKGISEPKTVDEQIRQGNSAAAVVNSPVFIEAFEILEDRYISNWISSSIDDKDHREVQFMSLRVLSEVRLELESMINSGKLAARHNQ